MKPNCMTFFIVQLSENIVLNPHAVEDFAERLWAYFTIRELLRKQIIADDNDVKDRLEERALELSLKYHFVTPLTSLVVVKPEKEMVNNNQTVGECDTEEAFDRNVKLSSGPRSGGSRPGSATNYLNAYPAAAACCHACGLHPHVVLLGLLYVIISVLSKVD